MDRNRIVAGLDIHQDRDFHVSTKRFHLRFGYDLAALCRILPFNPLAEFIERVYDSAYLFDGFRAPKRFNDAYPTVSIVGRLCRPTLFRQQVKSDC